jgi:hypothetical protein
MDVIRTFEDLSPTTADRDEPGALTRVGMALGSVLSEIDEIAKATFGSITMATMLRLIEREQRSQGESQMQRSSGREPRRAKTKPRPIARFRASPALD